MRVWRGQGNESGFGRIGVQGGNREIGGECWRTPERMEGFLEENEGFCERDGLYYILGWGAGLGWVR